MNNTNSNNNDSEGGENGLHAQRSNSMERMEGGSDSDEEGMILATDLEDRPQRKTRLLLNFCPRICLYLDT